MKTGLLGDHLFLAFSATGILLAMASGMLGLHSVQWDGSVVGHKIAGLGDGVVKQVGYMLAPNWGFAGIIVMPWAWKSLLRARSTVEPLIGQMLDSGMLVRRDGGAIDREKLFAAWERESGGFLLASISISLIPLLVFVMYDDFYHVVFKWLMVFSDDQIIALVTDPKRPVTINHTNYEFDWSIAALFDGMEVSRWANAAFAFCAYLIIPVIGAGTILVGFFWFFSICFFFSNTRLARQGLVIIPDLESADGRRGFEKFGPMFSALVTAAICTAALAVCMHLQNVFLRAPNESSILGMVFGDTLKAVPPIFDFNFQPLIESIKFMGATLELDPGSISKQTYVSAFVLLLLAMIVLSSLWLWLRSTAREGADWLRAEKALSDEDLDRLDEMNVWPVGWVSVNILLLVAVIVGASMFFVNLISFLALYAVIRGVIALFTSLRGPAKPGTPARRIRKPD